jgi:hypothetical protein
MDWHSVADAGKRKGLILLNRRMTHKRFWSEDAVIAGCQRNTEIARGIEGREPGQSRPLIYEGVDEGGEGETEKGVEGAGSVSYCDDEVNDTNLQAEYKGKTVAQALLSKRLRICR